MKNNIMREHAKSMKISFGKIETIKNNLLIITTT